MNIPDDSYILFVKIFVVLMFSAFFSGTEIAFVSSNKMRFEMDREESGLTSRIIDIFYKHPSNFISTILVGNNIALVIYGILMAKFIEGLVLQTVVSTVIVLFTGEFLPKTLFRINPNRTLHVCAIPAFIFYILLWPISKFTSGLSHMILFLLGMRVPKEKEDQGFRKADLDHLIQSNIENIDDENLIEEEVKIFQNALDFRNVKVRDCIVPRTEIVAVGMDATLSEIRNQFTDSGISKLVIYRDDLDDIVGFLHSSEMFRLKPGDDWTRCVRETPIVPETMSAQKLLSTLMAQKKSIAVVVDEFGGTSGIVTVEDLVEEIFGEIEDEHDKQDMVEKQISEREFVFSCRLEVEYLNEKYGLNIVESDEYDTLAGYIIAEHGGIPTEGEVLRNERFSITIISREQSRLDVVNIRIND